MSTVREAGALPASAEEAVGLGVEAYVYPFPLVLMELTRRQMPNLPQGGLRRLLPRAGDRGDGGLGANQPEDAIYPLKVADADGEPLDGEHDYVLHFENDELPPVAAFWSVTMYDEDGFQVANELNRFAIGDRDDPRFDDDGSLNLYLQHENPGADKQSNWLPSSREPLGVTMRLYEPAPEALDGRWSPPPIRRGSC